MHKIMIDFKTNEVCSETFSVSAKRDQISERTKLWYQIIHAVTEKLSERKNV